MNKEPDQSTKDRPFNPFRTPKTHKMRAVVSEAIALLQSFERDQQLRQRQRRPVDQKTFEETVTAIICDLMHRAITDPEGWLSISRSKQHLGLNGRYQAVAMNETAPTILDRLTHSELSLVVMEVGNQFHGQQTTIKAGPRLRSWMVENDIGLEDLTQTPTQEVIILKRTKVGYWDMGETVDYQDTDLTHQYRLEMQTINEWLASADIQFDPSILNEDRSKVDVNDRHLRRCFTQGLFQCGGRLFGGFWQPLHKWQRSQGILIDGHKVTTLDYAQMAPRILYGLTGEPLPMEDAYLIPGLERHRDGVKKVLNAMLFADHQLNRFPKETRQLFPSYLRWSDVVGKIMDIHEPIKHSFFTGIGHQLQFTESNIMVDVLLGLKKQDVVGLPIHDAVIIPSSFTTQVTELMSSIFKAHTGLDSVVSKEVI